MNILFWYPSDINPIKGGVQRVTHVLANELENRGYVIYFLSLNCTDIDDKRQFYLPDKKLHSRENISYLKDFCRLHQIHIVINQTGLSPYYSKFVYTLGGNAKIISVIHNSILAPILNFNTTYEKKSILLKISMLKNFLNSQVFKRTLLLLYKLKYKSHYLKLCRKSEIVLLLSDKFKSEVVFFVGTKVTNIDAIFNPCPFCVEIMPRVKKKELLYVGRIDVFQKRTDILIEIWSKLCFKYKDWNLNIVGDGPGFEAVRKLAISLGLINIEFHGFQNPKPFLESASIFCMTSSFEGFGVVLIEAMCYGVVPIAFDSYLSASDIIDNGMNGYLISPFDVEAYVQHLELLMNDSNKRNFLSVNAIKKSAVFSVAEIGEQWDKLLKKIAL